MSAGSKGMRTTTGRLERSGRRGGGHFLEGSFRTEGPAAGSAYGFYWSMGFGLFCVLTRLSPGAPSNESIVRKSFDPEDSKYTYSVAAGERRTMDIFAALRSSLSAFLAVQG